MKYVLSLIAGLALGMVSALAIVYFNPLTRGQGDQSPLAGWSLKYELGAEETWLSTHDNQVALPIVPKEAQLLWERGIRGVWLAAMPLDSGADRRAAAATRISFPASGTEFIHKGLLVEDFWLISLPDSGTLFVHAFNNQWPLLRDTLIRVNLLGREFSGPATYFSTLGPVDGHADVIGMTGKYDSVGGRAHERVSLKSFDGSLASASGQLLIELSDKGELADNGI